MEHKILIRPEIHILIGSSLYQFLVQEQVMMQYVKALNCAIDNNFRKWSEHACYYNDTRVKPMDGYPCIILYDINQSFIWALTPQGQQYWDIYHTKFYKYKIIKLNKIKS